MKIKRSITFFIFAFLLCSTMFCQGRAAIREAIEKEGNCRNVAITETNGDLALFGRNGVKPLNISEALYYNLSKLNKADEYIDDVVLTEKGSWLILYGDNNSVYFDIPYTLELKLAEFKNDGEVITSAVFNDNNDWIIVSTKSISSSDKRLQDWLVEGLETKGSLWTVCLTNDACVAVYEDGYKFLGNIPTELRAALGAAQLNVYRLKIAAQSYFFADKNGNYRYKL